MIPILGKRPPILFFKDIERKILSPRINHNAPVPDFFILYSEFESQLILVLKRNTFTYHNTLEVLRFLIQFGCSYFYSRCFIATIIIIEKTTMSAEVTTSTCTIFRVLKFSMVQETLLDVSTYIETIGMNPLSIRDT